MTRHTFPRIGAGRARPPAVICAAVLGFAAVATSAPPAWVELGPAPIVNGGYTGRVSAVVCSPTNPNKYFAAGADGGVWRTTDGGATWTPLTDFMPTTAMGALAMDPTDENVLYAGSGEANFANHSRYGMGLYKSADGGDTWVQLAANTFAGRCFSRIAIDPTNPQVLYASITHAGGFPARAAARGHPQAEGPLGVFKSTDGGVSWSHLTNGLPVLSATDLVLDPVNPQTVYAAIGDIFGRPDNGVYKSTNGGASWTKLSGGLPSSGVGRISLAISPSSPSVLYTIFVRESTSTGGGASTLNVYRTSNGGATWTPLNSGNFQATYGWYLSVAIVHPNDPDTVFVGGLSLVRSTNGGGTWSVVTPPHVDMHGLDWDAAGRLVVGDDGGIHRTTDLGESWTSHNTMLGCIQFYAGLSLSPAGPDYLYGGTQDNGTNYRSDSSQLWTQVLGGDGGYTGVRPAHPNYVFAEWQGSGNLYRSTNYGTGMMFSGSGINPGDRNCFLPPYAINPANDAKMLYGTYRVYDSGDAGANWTVRSGDLTNGGGAIRCLVLAPSNPQTVYVVTNDGNVHVSTDFGSTWTLSLTGVPGWPRTTRQIAVDPDDDQRAVLGVSYFGVDHILLTEDRGGSWTTIDGDLPDIPVNTVAIEARPNEDIIYAGTDRGVYRTLNGGVNWTLLGNNLPHVAVIDLIVDPANERLVAGTQGRGAWQIAIAHTGDFDADNDVDLDDYAALADCLAGPNTVPTPTPPTTVQDCLQALDFDGDGDVDLGDWAGFQAVFTGAAFADCNGNDLPDECDTDCGEPGGECDQLGCGQSPDCNTNGVPDECEPDCNTNGVADGCDIADGNSDDCNSNGVPDECEPDCNANGIADDCESAALITGHPEDQFPCSGQTAVFVVAAVGSPTYQWYKDEGALADGGNISGATTDTLTVSNVGPTDEGEYACRVTDGCIEATSGAATLSVAVAPSFPGTLGDLAKCEGEPVAFIANFTGTPPLSYQWEKDAVPIPGEESNVLTIDPVTPADAGNYRCKATNACGFAYTNTATLTVDPAPTITDQPDDTCAEVGETAEFTVAATGQGSLWYQWLKDGFDIPGEGGWNRTTLTLTNVQPADAGQYRVYVISSVSPGCLVYSDEATLVVGGCTTCRHARAGDMDDDGDVDLADFNLFQECFGPGMGLVPGCECSNMDDGNDDVDLADYALWYAEFNGGAP